MPERQEYEVKLEMFEGPLDLLLYLVSRAEVEITAISVAEVTGQYLQYLDLMRELSIDVAAEYLHMAATLLRLKARELLPHDPNEQVEGEEDEIYTREQLIRQLLEYKKYKEAADRLKAIEAHQIGSFGRGAADHVEVAADGEDEGIGNITLFDLLSAFRTILTRAQSEDPLHVVMGEDVRVDDRIERVLGLVSEKKEVRFEELFGDDLRRIALVATFMAILELVKMQELWFRQEERFGAIFVSRRLEKERVGLVAPQGVEGSLTEEGEPG